MIWRIPLELVARVGWTELCYVQQPPGINVGVRFANSNLRGLDELGNVDFGFDVGVEQAREIYEIMQKAQAII